MSGSWNGKPPRRVCILRQGYYPADPRVRREAAALVELGYEVDLICLRDEGQPRRECLDGVQVHRLPLGHRRGGIARYLLEYSAFPLLAALRLALLYRRRRYDVVQVNTMPDHLVFAAAFPKRRGARVILDMHEAMPELYRSKFGPSTVAPRVIAAVERLSTRFADRVITVSEPHRAVLAGRGLPAEKTSVVMNSPDERIFQRPRGQARRPPGFVLVSHGTLVQRYGFDIAIRAMVPLAELVPDARLVIIGDGELAPDLRRLAVELGIADRVQMLGRRPLEEIPAQLLQAHVGVVANRLDEFTDIVVPTKLMEYVALGLPAVVARSRAVEAYFDDSSVEFFDAGDPEDLARAVAELAADPDRARRMAASAADAFLTGHSWAQMKRVYGGVVDQLAADTGG